MSYSKIKALSKDSVIPLSLGLFISLVIGVWALAFRVSDWERRLDSFEFQLGYRWTYLMERDSWAEFSRLNQDAHIPNVKKIRDEILEASAR